jgi:hypothetical protein
VGAFVSINLQDNPNRWCRPGYGAFVTMQKGSAEGYAVVRREDLLKYLDSLRAHSSAHVTSKAGASKDHSADTPSRPGKKSRVGRPPRTELAPQQLRAISDELHATNSEPAACLVGGRIDWKSSKLVAKKAGVATRTIQNWRNHDNYIAEVRARLSAHAKK